MTIFSAPVVLVNGTQFDANQLNAILNKLVGEGNTLAWTKDGTLSATNNWNFNGKKILSADSGSDPNDGVNFGQLSGELLSTTTINNANPQIFSGAAGAFPQYANYRYLKMVLVDIINSVSAAKLSIQVSYDNSTFYTAYNVGQYGFDGSASPFSASLVGQTSGALTKSTAINMDTLGYQGSIDIFNKTSDNALLISDGSCQDSTHTVMSIVYSRIVSNTAGVVTGFTIIPSSGTLFSGKVSIFGWSNV